MNARLKDAFLQVGDIIKEDDTWRIYKFIKPKNIIVLHQNRDALSKSNSEQLIHGGVEFNDIALEKKVLMAGSRLRNSGRRFAVTLSKDELWADMAPSKAIIAKEISDSDNIVPKGITLKFYQGGRRFDTVNQVGVIGKIPDHKIKGYTL